MATALAKGILEKGGVSKYTAVTGIAPHALETEYGTVKAEVVVRATEAFTPLIPGFERYVVPIYSLMIGTEPLPDSFWDEVGWSGHEVFGDFRHLIFYAMHTDDGRIAIGGRGAPYHFNSRLSEAFERVRANYVRPVQDNELINGAIEGMVSGLDPPRACAHPLPAGRRDQGHAPLGRRHRGFPRLVQLRRSGCGYRDRLGRRLCRRRRGHDQPRRTHAVRPHQERRHGTHVPTLGESQIEAVGA